MARVLQIENFAVTSTINLLSTTGVCVFTGELDERPLKSDDGTITRVFGFRVNAATKALSRTAANAFIASLRKAVLWVEDDLEYDSWFLREGADGETAVRSLILNFEAVADSKGVAIDPYQNTSSMLYLKIALTLQNLREEPTKTTLSESYPTADYAVGKGILLYGGVATAPSRVSLGLISSLSGSVMTKFWIGMKPMPGISFQPIWYFDHADWKGAGTTESTRTGSCGTNIVKVAVTADSAMVQRARLNVYTQYNTASVGASAGLAKGRYVALVRYQFVTGSATVLARVGADTSNGAPISYNEARLLDVSGNWRFLNAGVVRFPGGSIRQEEGANNLIANCNLWLDVQFLAVVTSAEIVFDTITFIPYDHYIAVENTALSTLYTARAYNNEDRKVGSMAILNSDGSHATNGTITDTNNFIYPVASTVQLVIAAEKADSQVFNTNLDIDAVTIYEAFDAYNA